MLFFYRFKNEHKAFVCGMNEGGLSVLVLILRGCKIEQLDLILRSGQVTFKFL